jgi:hypothetical protein
MYNTPTYDLGTKHGEVVLQIACMPGIEEKIKYHHHLPYMLEENILVLEAYATHLARFLQKPSKLLPSKKRKIEEK